MGREHKKRRRMSIRQSQKRQAKLAKLRKAYLEAKDSSKKEQLLDKVFKIAPWLSKEEFLGAATQKSPSTSRYGTGTEKSQKSTDDLTK